MRAKYDRLGTIFKGIFDGFGRAASMRAVFVVMLGSYLSCGMMKSTWVKNSFVFGGHLIKRKCEELLETL